MRFKTRTWFLLSLLLFVASAFFWQLGEKQQAMKAEQKLNPASARPVHPRAGKTSAATVSDPSTNKVELAAAEMKALTEKIKKSFPNRLRNTEEPLGKLMQNQKAILLRNAMIDTTGVALTIPEKLRVKGDSGSYLVQSRGALSDAFRAELKKQGAEIISYIPNNAYLVRMTGDGAQKIASLGMTQAVLPYEPYYKLDNELLALAVEDKPLPADQFLRVTLFPGERETGLDMVKELGATVVGEDRSPFGEQLVLQAPADSLVKISQSTIVQGIETQRRRVLLNDRARVQVGVSTNTIVPDNYLGLTGTNVYIGVNDSGVDAGHPGLTNRIYGDPFHRIDFGTNIGDFYYSTNDHAGHGTHVAGTIAGDGSGAPTGTFLEDFYSDPDASFRGMAPSANIFSVFYDGVNGDNPNNNPISFTADAVLAEIGARTNLLVFQRNNTFISNNSWGYPGDPSYNSSAAIFDGATRDSVPGIPGSQPTLFVFAAGNSGGGDDSGQGGGSDSVSSPATAKNVISVGALESFRFITNDVISPYGCRFVTNALFEGMTDSSNQIAYFSGRGNVGVGDDGLYGRFKPDLVAPGTFMVSARTSYTNWANEYYNPTNYFYRTFTNLTLAPNGTNVFLPVFIPDNTVEFDIYVYANDLSSTNFPSLQIYTNTTPRPSSAAGNLAGLDLVTIAFPELDNCPGNNWYYDIVNTTNVEVKYDLTYLIVTTNKGNALTVLSNLDNQIGPNYRFESGTSMSAPVVSGVLALLQEFFEEKLQLTNSPALMKAMLINGSRSAAPDISTYRLRVNNLINYQGWGLVNLTNTIPEMMANTARETWPMQFFDQSPTNALATGQSFNYELTITNEITTNFPLRITLVWTDPPGNPAASIKLVNDLDLVVTNLDTGDVYYGNNFNGGSDFSDANLTVDPTNGVVVADSGLTNDFVNNVENIFLPGNLGARYTVSVKGHRVNVNAVNAHTNDVVQDFALVISAGHPMITNAFTISAPTLVVNTNPFVTYIPVTTNYNATVVSSGTLDLQHVGAISPLVTNNTQVQWNFYVVTNLSTFTNAEFRTFLPSTVSVGRNINYPRAVQRPLGPNSYSQLGRQVDADIDLYVSTNSALTNLDLAVMTNAWRSVTRNGTEVVKLTNSTQDTVYYVGVKSEDQEGSEYKFRADFRLIPSSQRQADGSYILQFGGEIPDGTPNKPGGLDMFADIDEPMGIAKIVVTNILTHELFGDLFGVIKHGGTSVVLNNHNSLFGGEPSGTNITTIYDELGEIVPAPGLLAAPDGPGSLTDFIGTEGQGTWTFTMVDDALSFTGRVDDLRIYLYPDVISDNSNGQLITIQPNRYGFAGITVPPTAVGMTISIAYVSGSGPVELYVVKDDGRRPRLPSTNNYDFKKIIAAPGDSLTITVGDIPPLSAGRYLIGVFNPSGSPVTLRLFYKFTFDLAATAPKTVENTTPVDIIDDTFTNSFSSRISFLNDETDHVPVADVRVGVRVDHERASDLVMRLMSPSGTSILLSENRGGLGTNGFGMGTNYNELAYATFSEDTNTAFQPIKFATAPAFLDFIRPQLQATNFMRNSTNQLPFKNAAGNDQEDHFFLHTGSTNGSFDITWDFLFQPDQMQVFYEGVLLYDSGVTNNYPNLGCYPFEPCDDHGGEVTVHIVYSGTNDVVEIVMNQGGSTPGTIWNYTLSNFQPSAPTASFDQHASGVAIKNGNLYLSGITEANRTNGIVARFGLPMQDNALPIYDLNWPDNKGNTRFNGVAASSEGVYLVGNSEPQTTDGVGAKDAKGIVVKFPLTTPVINPSSVQGQIWYQQTPASGVFPYGGSEELRGTTVTMEGTNTFIYVTGDAKRSLTNIGRLYVSKLDTNGTVLWTMDDSALAAGDALSSGHAVVALHTNIYVAGISQDSGQPQAYLLKYSSTGARVWERFSTAVSQYNGVATYNGFIYAVGSTKALSGSSADYLVEKWDEEGNLVWSLRGDLFGDSENILNSVVAYGNRLYAVGSTRGVGGRADADALLLEINQDTGTLVTNYNAVTTYDAGQFGDDIAHGAATDGFDLYLVGEGVLPSVGTNNITSDAMLLRYRIKNDYLPEESLSLLNGEDLYGNWRLDIWDNREGAVMDPSKLLGWQLQLHTAPTNTSAVVLYDNNSVTGLVTRAQTRYFIVDVPFAANECKIKLQSVTGGELDLYFNQFVADVNDGGTVALATNMSTVVTTNLTYNPSSIPALVPGQRFYLVLENSNPSLTNEFIITVSFDNAATTFTSSSSPASGSLHSGTNGNNLYQFEVAQNDSSMAVLLTNLTGDVDVYLRRGAIPNSENFDYHQIFTGTTFGQILVRPKPSQPDVSGTWFVSVRNRNSGSADYQLIIVEGNHAPILASIGNKTVAKGNILSFTAHATDEDDPLQLLSFSLDSGAPVGATISASGQFTWTPIVASTNTLVIRVTDNGSPTMSDSEVITIIVTEINSAPVFSSPQLTAGGELTLTWSSVANDQYEVQRSSNLVDWTTTQSVTATGATTSYTTNINADAQQFYRVRQIP